METYQYISFTDIVFGQLRQRIHSFGGQDNYITERFKKQPIFNMGLEKRQNALLQLTLEDNSGKL